MDSWLDHQIFCKYEVSSLKVGSLKIKCRTPGVHALLTSAPAYRQSREESVKEPCSRQRTHFVSFDSAKVWDSGVVRIEIDCGRQDFAENESIPHLRTFRIHLLDGNPSVFSFKWSRIAAGRSQNKGSTSYYV